MAKKAANLMPQTGTILIDDNSPQSQGSLLFAQPNSIIIAEEIEEIDAALKAIEDAIKAQKYVAGFFSYELGLAFEPALKKLMPKNRNMPLLWFGVYEKPQKFTPEELQAAINQANRGAGFRLHKRQAAISQNEYETAFAKVHNYIKTGHIYQANLTFKIKYDFAGSAFAFYEALRNAQNVQYGAYIDIGGAQILSLSPELFFNKYGQKIETKPMKGTAKRGSELEDIKIIESLQTDPKQRAENLMIVDLMRNDLSRISKTGSVKVPQLFSIETYSTLHQMTSLVEAQLHDNIGIGDIIKGIFPAGSITGCPKIRAMEIIEELETEPRGAYCGSIGYFDPNGFARFNVAIRTPTIIGDKLELGVGSGLVYDSFGTAEYAECLLKSRFMRNSLQDYSVFETLKWERSSGFIRLEKHLNRLENSARALNMLFNRALIEKKLSAKIKKISWDAARIKIILLAQDFKIEIAPFVEAKEEIKIKLSNTIMQSNNPWLYHKTSLRTLYDDEWKEAQNMGFGEIIYQNENGELTEGSRSNIFLDMGDGILLTPKIECGLLPGVLREELLANGRAKEAILTLQDIESAQNIYIGNSLRGLIKAVFIRN